MLFPSFVLLFRQLLLSPFSLPPSFLLYLIRVFSFTEFLSLFGSLDRSERTGCPFFFHLFVERVSSFACSCFSLFVFLSFDRWCVSFLSTDDTRFVSNRDGWIDRYFRLSSMVEILCERKDGKLIVNAINHLLPPPLSLSFSLLHLSHTFITRIDFSLLFLIFPTLSYSHSPSFFLLFSSLGFCSLFSHADISYLVRILDRHLIYGDTYIQKEYQKNKYICKYIYVYI